MALSLRLLCLVSFFSFFSSSPATDTLTPSDMLRDNQTLVSSGGLFEFGFFGESVSGYYLGIWFTADPSNCKDGGAFSEMNGSLPSTSAGSGGSIGISECQTLCQVNCSCTAFASVQNESVCQLYYGSKQNLLKIVEGPGLIYIRDGAPSEDQARREGIINSDHEVRGAIYKKFGRQKDQELPLFSFSTIKAATSDFAKANKLGEVDSGKRVLLDWRKRMNIIEGIAQGLLYPHKYSRLRIIHRDLKTSNILLDCDMNPKISDFGMARIFGDNDTRGQTNRVVGTFGYMSPEYAMDGLFSEKSDVFSFGVIILEIVSGKKSISFFEADQSLNLLGKAWDLWKKGKTMELMDPTLRNYFSSTEVTRCIQMGLLYVQERAMDRPTMSDVVLTLSNETIALPLPKEPAFLSRSSDAELSSSRQRRHSGSDITISEVDGR
ncbi:PREDICTED: G-type lectin S-receptor [Prunus dulcis]|uniref:non-specific serine/threonine protein kinase n=1 Tax=Prunus dulcis TaxID=3755 RepID=A0A5E4EMM8_PRUDU|nr:PREDICTED: G-type lectin S-receptor [Prunus dulcis]